MNPTSAAVNISTSEDAAVRCPSGLAAESDIGQYRIRIKDDVDTCHCGVPKQQSIVRLPRLTFCLMDFAGSIEEAPPEVAIW